MIIVMNSGQFGRNVQKLRRRMKLSRLRLAKKTGIGVVTLYRIETGRLLDIDYQFLRRLCGVLGVRSEDLIM